MPTRHEGDEEAPKRSSSHRVVEGQQSMLTSTKFPPNYATFIDLLKLTYIPVKWVRLLVFNILKQLFNRVKSLEELKRNHKQAMKLISCLATYEGYWDFIEMGKKPKQNASEQLGGSGSQRKPDPHDFSPSLLPNQHVTTPPHQEGKGTQMNGDSKGPSGFPWNDPPLTLGAIMGIHELLGQILKMCQESAGDSEDSGGSQSNNSPSTLDAKIRLHEFVSQILKMHQESAGVSKNRWNDSPLTLGAKMGLHEFVSQILKECPESANYTDPEGKNVLQVAIHYGHGKIVDFVESLTRNGNPVLPSWLLSKREDNTNNTILHFAAETAIKGGSPALQVQSELQWFERVKKLVPIDLWNSRNKEEMTAQELFTKKHEKMVLESRDQLREIGKTCSGLLAAVVFATSISIPQGGDNQDLRKTTTFKVFADAYEIGLSCAATALVLFISLLTATYKEQEFRRSIPTKYFLAMTSFFMAMLCLLVAFICNIYLSMYGGKGKVTILVGELIAVPIICFIVLACRGCRFGIKSFFRDVWR